MSQIEARKKATDYAVKLVQAMLPKSDNGERTRKRLEALSDKEFEELMVKFQNEEDYLQLITPVGEDDYRLDIDNLQNVADKYKINFYHKIWMYSDDGSRELSNKKSMVLHLPVRIQQATGSESKGGRISYPEVNNLLSMGLIKTAEEMMHFRGGSENGNRLLEQSIVKMGQASANALKPYTGQVGANKMLHSYLTAMMLKSTLLY